MVLRRNPAILLRRKFLMGVGAVLVSAPAIIRADAYWQSVAQQSVAAPSTTTTWNPLDKDAGTTLSNGNLTSTGTADARSGVRAIASASTGKKYSEIHADTLNGIASFNIGVADASAGLDANSQLGGDTHSIGISGSGAVTLNGSGLGSGDSWVAGNTIGVAVDIGNNLIWFRVNGGLWLASGTANPATGVGGFDISGRAAGALFAAVNSGKFGSAGQFDVFTANFGATSYANAAPSGFGNW